MISTLPFLSHGLLLCLFCLLFFGSLLFCSWLRILCEHHGYAGHQSDDRADVFGFLFCLDTAV